MTRRGALARSDSLDGLSPAGWKALRDHGIRTIVDLRNDDDDERVERPELSDGVEVVNLPLDRLDEGTGLVAIAVLAAAGVESGTIAEDYVLAADRAHTHDAALEEFLAERGTSARELVIELAEQLDLDRPALRDRLVVERAP